MSKVNKAKKQDVPKYVNLDNGTLKKMKNLVLLLGQVNVFGTRVTLKLGGSILIVELPIAHAMGRDNVELPIFGNYPANPQVRLVAFGDDGLQEIQDVGCDSECNEVVLESCWLLNYVVLMHVADCQASGIDVCLHH
jgi:hypothetical protein